MPVGPLGQGTGMANETGTVLTCTNADCGCRLRIEQPCPHGDTYTCACGHTFEEAPHDPIVNAPA